MMGKMTIMLVLILSGFAFGLRADCNGDGRVDFLDLAILAEEWLMDVYGIDQANGTFDEDLSGWNPVIFEWGGSGVATCESSSPETATLTKTLPITAGTTYHVSWDIDRSAGASEWTLTIILGGTEYAAGVITAGSFSTDIVAGGDDLDLVIELHTADAGSQWASLDNISVQEVFDVPVIEAIARDIETAINEVTVANGYDLTLTAIRPRRLDFSEILLNDGKVFIWQGDHNDIASGATMAAEWRVDFQIGAIVIDSDSETDSIQIRLNQVAADIQKKLKEDVTRGGAAIDTLFPSIAQIDDVEYTGVIVNITVQYRTQYTDPYTLI